MPLSSSSPPLLETTNPYGGHSYLTPSGHIVDPTAPSPPPPSQPPTHHHHPALLPTLFDLGILKNTLLPSLTLHSTLAAAAYTAGRLTDRLDAKDLIWPLGPLLNAWHSAILRHVFSSPGISLRQAFSSLSRVDGLILGGVTLWGTRLFARIAGRARKRGKDDPRYEALKKRHGWNWNRSLWRDWMPEVAWLSLVTLPVVAPFRLGYYSGPVGGGRRGGSGWGEAVAVGLFCAGLAMEGVADWQLEEFKSKGEETKGKMCREGVWGIVRHPNYLGDALVHFSFPLLLWANDMLMPVALLGPVANYLFLRYVGGEKQNEYAQSRRYSSTDVSKKIEFDRYRREKNSFWPDASQVSNRWMWIIIGCGVAGAVTERVLRRVL